MSGSIQQQPVKVNTVIKTYTGFHPVVIKRGLGFPYCIWLVLRAMDDKGTGAVYRDRLLRARKALQFQGPRQFAAGLAAIPQADIFFTVDGDRITYKSLEHVAQALGEKPGQPVELPLAALVSKGQFAAELYGSWFAGFKRGVTISRERLMALFGVADRTLQRWEKRVGVQVTSNIGSCPAEDYDKAEHIIPRDKRDGEREGRLYTWNHAGRICWMLPNSYNAPAGRYTRLPHGASQKVKLSAVKGADLSGGAALGRVFYRVDSLPENYQLVPSKKTCYLGNKRTFKIGRQRTAKEFSLLIGKKPVTRREAGIA